MMERLEESKNLEAAERAKLEEEIRAKQEEVVRIQQEVEQKDEETRRLQVSVHILVNCCVVRRMMTTEIAVGICRLFMYVLCSMYMHIAKSQYKFIILHLVFSCKTSVPEKQCMS
jgi:ribonuclease HII